MLPHHVSQLNSTFLIRTLDPTISVTFSVSQLCPSTCVVIQITSSPAVA